jgi:hypothetical protein
VTENHTTFIEQAHPNAATNRPATTVAAASTDWFGLACQLLAPGARNYSTTAIAITWDAYDRLEAAGWTPRYNGQVRESMRRDLSDGEAVVFPPQTERPPMRLCLHCDGHGTSIVEDEDGNPHRLKCVWCDGTGGVPRPFSPLPGGGVLEELGLTAADFGVRPLKPGEVDLMDPGF